MFPTHEVSLAWWDMGEYASQFRRRPVGHIGGVHLTTYPLSRWSPQEARGDLIVQKSWSISCVKQSNHFKVFFCNIRYLEPGWSGTVCTEKMASIEGTDRWIFNIETELAMLSACLPTCILFLLYARSWPLQCIASSLLCIHRRWSDRLGSSTPPQPFCLSHFPRLDSLHIRTILTAITCAEALNIDFMGLDGARKILVRAQ